VRGIGDELAERIAAGRPYRDMEDFQRRIVPSLPVIEALATAGAFGCFGLDRRAALWAAGAVAQSKPDRLPGVVTGVDAPALPGMTELEVARSDLWATGVAPTGHPTRFVRSDLDRRGAVTVAGLPDVDDGTKVLIGGVVTHRQRPATASGITFLNLEDETGMVNVVCSKGCWVRYRQAARGAPALLVRGKLEKAEGAINVVAEVIEPLPIGVPSKSRDFR
jgi:error-prone DNA polymerase